MMISFKQFLAEAAVGADLKYEIIENLDDVVEMVKKNCKDASWMIENNDIIYRGGDSGLSYSIVDPSLTKRKSENTSNYYTEILDNNPYCKDFPKRSRSLICTTDKHKSMFYGGTYVVIPYDGVKIGNVNSRDIFKTRIKLFGVSAFINEFNTNYWGLDGLALKDNINSFKNFDKKLKNRDSKAIQNFYETFTEARLPDNFLDDIWRAYSPNATGFTVHTTKTLQPLPYDVELWIGGPCILIKLDEWRVFRSRFLGEL